LLTFGSGFSGAQRQCAPEERRRVRGGASRGRCRCWRGLERATVDGDLRFFGRDDEVEGREELVELADVATCLVGEAGREIGTGALSVLVERGRKGFARACVLAHRAKARADVVRGDGMVLQLAGRFECGERAGPVGIFDERRAANELLARGFGIVIGARNAGEAEHERDRETEREDAGAGADQNPSRREHTGSPRGGGSA